MPNYLNQNILHAIRIFFSKAKPSVFLPILAFFTLLIYLNHFDNAFHFDDHHTIVNNPAIRYLHNFFAFYKDPSLLSILPTNQAYRPFTFSLFTVDYALGNGLNPFWFHVTSFIIYLLQIYLVYLFLIRLLPGENSFSKKAVTYFITAFYAFHAANAETVNYIIVRADMLSSLFLSIFILLYTRKEENVVYKTMALLALLIGMFSKETTVTAFLVLAAYYWVYDEKADFSSAYLSHFIRRTGLPTLICLGSAFFILSYMSGTYTPGGTSRWAYVCTQPYIILLYFLTYLAPLRLSADTDEQLIKGYFDPKILIGLLFLSALFYVVYTARKKNETKSVSFGLLWFVITLLPTSSVIPLAEVMNDHRIFMPFVGLTIGFAGALLWTIQTHKSWIFKHTVWVLSIGVFLLSAHAYGTFVRNGVWDSDEKLWHDVTLKSPQNGRGLMNYGLTQMAKGQYNEALSTFNQALQYSPQYAYLHVNLGVCKNAMGNATEAETNFKNGVLYGSYSAEPFTYYGNFLKEKGRYAEAEDQYKKAISVSYAHLDARRELIALYLSEQRLTEATQLIDETLKISPEDQIVLAYRQRLGDLSQKMKNHDFTKEEYISQSLLFYQQGKYDEMIAACEKALEIDPNYALAYNNICSGYNQLKQWDKAAEACRKALAIDASMQIARNNLKLAIDAGGK